MYKLVLILLILIIFTSCTSYEFFGINSSLSGLNRHQAMYCSQVWGELFPTRIAFGLDKENGEYHMQSQFFNSRNGKWVWLSFNTDKGECYSGEQERILVNPKFISWIEMSVAQATMFPYLR